MKKICLLFTAFCLLICLSGCGRTAGDPSITAEEALDKALAKVGAERDAVRDIETNLEVENGKLVYDIDFKVGDAEYSFDVDAKNGSVYSDED